MVPRLIGLTENLIFNERRTFTLSADECENSLMSNSANTSFGTVKLKHSIVGSRRKKNAFLTAAGLNALTLTHMLYRPEEGLI